MLILAGGCIWLSVVIFNNLNGLKETIEGWLDTAFENHGQVLDGQFRAIESLVSIFSEIGCLRLHYTSYNQTSYRTKKSYTYFLISYQKLIMRFLSRSGLTLYTAVLFFKIYIQLLTSAGEDVSRGTTLLCSCIYVI